MDRPDVLYAWMLGNFRLYYNGHPLTGERMRDTYFTGLMQILLYYGAEGVSRDYLEDVLLGDRDVDHQRQALQTIVYKAKKKLRKMGLPEANYIYLEKGVYYWTPQIPVCVDAVVFDELCRKAEDCAKEEERFRLCLDACYLYKGEFLSTYTAVLWAGAEARRYHTQFCKCVEYAASVLRSREEWQQLEELGRYVTEVEPYCDWESLTMEALIGRGQYEEARRLYADTADSYLKECGVCPSSRIMEMMEKLGSQMHHPYEVLDQIQQRLKEDPKQVQGGYQCSFPVFCGIYHLLMRMMERGGQSVYLMLCTLVDGRGNPIKEGERLEKLSERLAEAVRSSVRHGDIINRYGSGQFLVLLVNTTREDCDLIKRRIDQRFIIGRQRARVQYYVNSMICEN